ncbi:hypothetical protein RFI_35287, partial [Reticulomyxa filosa]
IAKTNSLQNVTNNFLQVGGRDDKQIGIGNHLQNETFNAKDNAQSAMISNHLQEKRYAKNDGDCNIQHCASFEEKIHYLQVKNDNYLQSHKTRNVSKKGIYSQMNEKDRKVATKANVVIGKHPFD